MVSERHIQETKAKTSKSIIIWDSSEREVKGTGKEVAQAKTRHSRGVPPSPSPDPRNTETDEDTSKGKCLLYPYFRPATDISERDRPWFYSLTVHGPMDVSVFSKRSSALQTDRRNPWACYHSASLCIFFFFLATLHSKWDLDQGSWF